MVVHGVQSTMATGTSENRKDLADVGLDFAGANRGRERQEAGVVSAVSQTCAVVWQFGGQEMNTGIGKKRVKIS